MIKTPTSFPSPLLAPNSPHSQSTRSLHVNVIFRLLTVLSTHRKDRPRQSCCILGNVASSYSSSTSTSWLSPYKTDIPIRRKDFTFSNKKTQEKKNNLLLQNGMLWLGEEQRSSNVLCWLLLVDQVLRRPLQVWTESSHVPEAVAKVFKYARKEEENLIIFRPIIQNVIWKSCCNHRWSELPVVGGATF
jgi:hypothetical protein